MFTLALIIRSIPAIFLLRFYRNSLLKRSLFTPPLPMFQEYASSLKLLKHNYLTNLIHVNNSGTQDPWRLYIQIHIWLLIILRIGANSFFLSTHLVRLHFSNEKIHWSPGFKRNDLWNESRDMYISFIK